MERTQFSWNGFYAMPVIGIMRNISAADVADILPLYYDSGLTTIEVTMNSPGFEESIRLALQNFAGKVNIGAGTVCTEKDLESALHAGAQFIVTPVIDLKVIELCKQSGIPVFAGAYTPTEIFTAWNAGADMVKIFPAIANGIEYIKAVKGPFPRNKIIADRRR
ncbi:MAG: bifunctional 4-hydroxy-2-oxoglutarate aldolase/2-dehydro-3-deoxy-phosphogluconate aldolase [Bacteroidota bacterium]